MILRIQRNLTGESGPDGGKCKCRGPEAEGNRGGLRN